MLNLVFMVFAMFWALAASREPMRVFTPALANRMAIALPSLPVPPITASEGLGFIGVVGVDICFSSVGSTSRLNAYIFYGTYFWRDKASWMEKSMADVKYVYGDEALLDQIGALWDKLRLHHLQRSRDWKQLYQEWRFAERKAGLLRKTANGRMRVDLALDAATGEIVGYCVSSVDDDAKVGEIDSIFVSENHRNQGVGYAIVRKALAWMDENGVEKKKVEVAAGNEEAFAFYAKFGFRPRKTLLEQVKH
jgi:ribosomal protein S18 acetylase RimI-like enzyme